MEKYVNRSAASDPIYRIHSSWYFIHNQQSYLIFFPLESNFGGKAYHRMIESKEIGFRSTVISTSIDRANSLHLDEFHDESFYRSASFMDIARQTSEHGLSITLHRDDTVINKISPTLSKRLVKVKYLISFILELSSE